MNKDYIVQYIGFVLLGESGNEIEILDTVKVKLASGEICNIVVKEIENEK